MKTAVQILIAAAGASALKAAPSMRLRDVRMQAQLESPPADDVRVPKTSVATAGWQTVVQNARGRAAALKEDQDATTAVMATSAATFFALPVVDNLPADLFLSVVVGASVGFIAGFREDGIGDAARSVGQAVNKASSTVGQKIDETGVLDTVKSKLPGGGGEGLSYAEIKKYGIAGTLAYILTELAFWAVAFPVASTTFYNTAGHWPDFSDGSDRTAVLAFIFAGANVARLVVPLRFGAAFALIPWVDENIVQKFGIGGNSDETSSSD